MLKPVADPAQSHWRLIEARWADEIEAQGRAYVYVRTLDENGQPLEGATFQADRGDAIDKAQTKGPVDQYLGNYLMTGTLGTYELSMAQNDLPSDKLINVGLGTEVSPRDYVPTSFFLTFQKVVVEDAPSSPAPEELPVDETEPSPGLQPGPVPPSSLLERRLDARFKNLHPQVLLEPVADPAQPYWRLVEARWADKQEAQGRAYIFVKALGQDGQPLEGATFQADRGDAIDKADTKGPLDQYLGNYMMTGTLGTYKVSMAQDDLPSDTLVNVGFGDEVSDALTSFYLTFQKVAGEPSKKKDEQIVDPAPTPITGPHLDHPADKIEAAPELWDALMLASHHYIIPVSRRSRLYRYAQANNLGQFLSAEFPLQHQGVEYQAQVFEKGIAYFALNHPETVRHVSYQAQIKRDPSSDESGGSSSVWDWFKQLMGWG